VFGITKGILWRYACKFACCVLGQVKSSLFTMNQTLRYSEMTNWSSTSTTTKMNITVNKISGACTRIGKKSNKDYGLVKLAKKLKTILSIKSRKTSKIRHLADCSTF